MASYNDYKEIKNKNYESIILVKSGVFFETYDKSIRTKEQLLCPSKTWKLS